MVGTFLGLLLLWSSLSPKNDDESPFGKRVRTHEAALMCLGMFGLPEPISGVAGTTSGPVRALVPRRFRIGYASVFDVTELPVQN